MQERDVKPKKRARRSRRRQSSLGPLLLAVGGLAVLALATFFVLSNGSRPKAAVTVQGAPSLKVQQDTIDRGNVELGTTIEVAFEVSNVGDQPLTISEQPYVELAAGC
jgi:hypothetical protein